MFSFLSGSRGFSLSQGPWEAGQNAYAFLCCFEGCISIPWVRELFDNFFDFFVWEKYADVDLSVMPHGPFMHEFFEIEVVSFCMLQGLKECPDDRLRWLHNILDDDNLKSAVQGRGITSCLCGGGLSHCSHVVFNYYCHFGNE